jgi:hypothetical protein
MTKKDYEVMAKMLNDLNGYANEQEHHTLQVVATRMITIFEKDNPNFSTRKFLEACGMKPHPLY